MINLRLPLNMSTPLVINSSKFTTSSRIFDKFVDEDLPKYVLNQDKIKTEKFRKMVVHIQEINEKPTIYETGERQQELMETYSKLVSDSSNLDDSTTPDKIEITNVSGTLSEVFKEDSKSLNYCLADTSAVQCLSKLPLDISQAELIKSKQSSRQGNGITMLSIKKQFCPYYADLSSVDLPLIFHTSDSGNILIANYIQTLREPYIKTRHLTLHLLEANVKLFLQKTKSWNEATQIVVQDPLLLKDFLAQNTTSIISMVYKTYTLLSEEKKEPPVGEKPKDPIKPKDAAKPNAFLEKAKEAFDSLIGFIKKKMEEFTKKKEEQSGTPPSKDKK